MIGSARLVVRLTPRADGDRIDGWTEDAAGRAVLNVRTAARPIDGRANAALERTIARALDVAPTSVRVQAGGGARVKTLKIEGLDDESVRRRLGAP